MPNIGHSIPAQKNVELGYGETTTVLNATAAVDIPGLTVSVAVGARPVVVIFDAPGLKSSVANGFFEVQLFEDGVAIGYCIGQSGAAAAYVPAHREIRRAPSAGTHTYKAQLSNATVGGTATLNAGTTASGIGPASLRVVEV